MSSLLDIIFILLIFSMLSMSFQKEFDLLELDLPQGEGTNEKAKEEPIRIYIKENGEMYFQNQKVNWNDLESLLSKVSNHRRFQIGIEKKVYYEEFIKLSNLLKKFGIQKIDLLLETKP